MAVNNLQFGATVSRWARKSERRMLAILRESTQRVISKAQSRVPVDTGFCRASVRASLQSMPQINPGFRPVLGQTYSAPTGEVFSTIASAQLGDTIHVGWTASYAGILETGSSQQAPTGFVKISAMEWPSIVRRVTAEAKARVR